MRPERQPLRHRGAGRGDPPRADDVRRGAAPPRRPAARDRSSPPPRGYGPPPAGSDPQASGQARGAGREGPAGATPAWRRGAQCPRDPPRPALRTRGGQGPNARRGGDIGRARGWGGARRWGRVARCGWCGGAGGVGSRGRRGRGNRSGRRGAISGRWIGDGSGLRIGMAWVPAVIIGPGCVGFADAWRSGSSSSPFPLLRSGGGGSGVGSQLRPPAPPRVLVRPTSGSRGGGSGARSSDGSIARAAIAVAPAAPARAAWRQLDAHSSDVPSTPRRPPTPPARPGMAQWPPDSSPPP